MKRILFWIMIALFVFIIYFLNYKINSYDLAYYYGKDNGSFIRAKTIILSSIVFCVIMASRKKLLFGFIGVINGIFAVILSYLIAGKLDLIIHLDFGLLYHILGYILFMLFFYFCESTINNKLNSGSRQY
jgi:hypothetical protein